MPHRPPHACARPRCPNLTHGRYCSEHEQERQQRYDQERGSSHERGYGAAWRKLRARILLRDPVCRDCKREPSTEVDHIVPRARGGTDDDSNLQGLCHTCHSRKTSREDGRWRQRRPRAS